ncbi:ATP-binding protein [Sphingomonas sp.]|uniref:ATP-binding protein n=1 Tax=Sphingomonas sp. TaxID=28214 RepID=UPI003B39FB0A
MLSDRLRFREISNLTTFRLTLWFGLLFALGVLALLGTIYVLTAHELNARSDRVLRYETARLEKFPPADLAAAMREEMANGASRLNYYALLDKDGRRLVGNMRPPPGLKFDEPKDVGGLGGPKPIRMIALRVPNGQTLVIGRDITPLVDFRYHILLILGGSGFAIALLVLSGGFFLSLKPMRRVRALERAGRDIARGDLSVRMPVTGRGDELDQLASVVNVMVDEVETMLVQVREVTDVIAHDLRAPMGRVRNQLVRARQLHQGDAALEPIFGSALVEIDNVLDRFTALLRIAELKASHRIAGFGPVQAAELVRTVGDLHQPVAEERGITLDVRIDGRFVLEGDEHLLLEALSNLVDNGLKFTPEGGRVILSTRQPAEGAGLIEVSDNGPGIPTGERDKVLRRFYRGSNATQVGGSGIGLSVVATILHIHGFALELRDADPGLCVRIRGEATGRSGK